MDKKRNLNRNCYKGRRKEIFLTFLLLLCLIVFSKYGKSKSSLLKEEINTCKNSAIFNVPTKNTNPQPQYGFIENKGQFINDQGEEASNVLFKARYPNVDFYVTHKGLSFVFFERKRLGERNKNNKKGYKIKYRKIDMSLKEASIIPSNVVKEEPSKDYYNYYLPHCSQGIFEVYRYNKITVKNIYNGIDWILKCNETGQITQEFFLHPNANPGTIKMIYSNCKDVVIRQDGNVEIDVFSGKIVEAPLEVFEANGTMINAKYDLRKLRKNKYEVSLDLSKDYNNDLFVVVDPAIAWSTFYGNTSFDSFNDINIQGSDVWVIGSSQSSSFPLQDIGGGAYYQSTKNGWQDDVTILKFNTSGVRQWSTFYGGNNGDYGYHIFCDGTDVWATGISYSSDFPTYDPGGGAYYQAACGGCTADRDAFILKFNTSGVRQWATYYGGTAADEGYSIHSDGVNVWVAGLTRSNDMPTQNPGGGAYYQGTFGGGTDMFILKFNSSGVRQWATYYGEGWEDEAYDIFSDGSNVWLVGNSSFETGSLSYNPGGGAYYSSVQSPGWKRGAFIVKFSTSGLRQWATYYDGSDNDYGTSIYSNGTSIWVTGYTYSTDFPIYDPGNGAYYQSSNGGGSDAFILKFNTAGVRQWATYYGGSANDQAKSLWYGNTYLYVTGYTDATDFPVLNPGSGFYQGTNGGGSDAFILEFDGATSARQWATYIGGVDSDQGMGVFADANANWLVGNTLSNNFPITDPGGGAYYQSTRSGAEDAFIVKFGTTPPLPIELLYFSVEWFDNNFDTAKIEWATASEINNNYFEIQRSLDGINFSVLKTVQGAGNSSSIIVYTKTDDNPIKDAVSYYRLKQVDIDGQFSYSNIVALNVPNGIDIINIWPNPSVDYFTFLVTSSESTNLNIDIVNMQGKMIQQITKFVEQGATEIVISTHQLSSGSYFTKVVTESGVYQDQMQFVVNRK